MTTCAYCRQPCRRPVYHHPDREGKPDHKVPMHKACHTRQHSERGDFRRYGAKSSGAGVKGYQAALAACPFHRLGGERRAATAERDPATGRFLKGAR